MVRKFGVGDIITIVGISLYFIFLLVQSIVYWVEVGFKFPLGVNQIIMVLLTGIPIFILVSSFKNPNLLNVQLAFAVVILFLRFIEESAIVCLRDRGYDFYIVLGALAIGFGAYVTRAGMSILGIEEPPSQDSAI